MIGETTIRWSEENCSFSVSSSQTDWWLAKDYKTGLKGYIPALYVAPHGGLDVNE